MKRRVALVVSLVSIIVLLAMFLLFRMTALKVGFPDIEKGIYKHVELLVDVPTNSQVHFVKKISNSSNLREICMQKKQVLDDIREKEIFSERDYCSNINKSFFVADYIGIDYSPPYELISSDVGCNFFRTLLFNSQPKEVTFDFWLKFNPGTCIEFPLQSNSTGEIKIIAPRTIVSRSAPEINGLNYSFSTENNKFYFNYSFFNESFGCYPLVVCWETV